MKRIRFLLFFLGLFLLKAGASFGQFQYFGVDEQLIISPLGSSQLVTSLNYLKQFGIHHGVGVEIGLPIMLSGDRAKFYEDVIDSANYDVGLIWKRNFLPYLGLRYRLFVGNSFFIGTSFNVGVLREKFYADRYYHVATTSPHEAINPVYLDYTLKSPFVRLNFETGFIWNMGQRMYGTFQGRLGIQATKPPVEEFGTFTVNKDLEMDFVPYGGTDFIGGLAFGLGIKL